MSELEGDAVRHELEFVLRVAVERKLWARGRLDASEVAGGTPEGACSWPPYVDPLWPEN